VSTPPSKLPISEARVNEANAPLRTPSQGAGVGSVLPRFVAWHPNPLPLDLALASGLERSTLANLEEQGLPIPVHSGSSQTELGDDPRLAIEEVKGMNFLAWAAGISLGLLGTALGASSLLFVAASGPLVLIVGLALGLAGPAAGGFLVARAHKSRSAKTRALRIAAQSKAPTPLQERVRALAISLRRVDLPEIAERDLIQALIDLNADLSARPNQARTAELDAAVSAVEGLLASSPEAGQVSDPKAVLLLVQAAHQARGETQ
jgi:hypothetical protein